MNCVFDAVIFLAKLWHIVGVLYSCLNGFTKKLCVCGAFIKEVHQSIAGILLIIVSVENATGD